VLGSWDVDGGWGVAYINTSPVLAKTKIDGNQTTTLALVGGVESYTLLTPYSVMISDIVLVDGNVPLHSTELRSTLKTTGVFSGGVVNYPLISAGFTVTSRLVGGVVSPKHIINGSSIEDIVLSITSTNPGVESSTYIDSASSISDVKLWGGITPQTTTQALLIKDEKCTGYLLLPTEIDGYLVADVRIALKGVETYPRVLTNTDTPLIDAVLSGKLMNNFYNSLINGVLQRGFSLYGGLDSVAIISAKPVVADSILPVTGVASFSVIEGALSTKTLLSGAIVNTPLISSTLYTESYLQSSEVFTVPSVIDSSSYITHVTLQGNIATEIVIGESTVHVLVRLEGGVGYTSEDVALKGQIKTDVFMKTEGSTLGLKGDLVPVEDIVVMEQSLENIPLTPFVYSMNNYTMLVDFFGNNGIITECSLGSWDIGVYSGDPYRNTWQLEIVSATLLLEIETPLEDS
jgi:hypothetical protein